MDLCAFPCALRLRSCSEGFLQHAALPRPTLVGARYTSIGAVLVAVNPYKLLTKAGKSIYHESVAHHYMAQNRLGLVPHVFKVGVGLEGRRGI